MSQPQVLVSTRNPSKFREFCSLFRDLPASLLSLADIPQMVSGEEVGDSFEAIAVRKAEEACTATGLIAVADDSGLEVEALEGAPGIYSHRFLADTATDADRNQEILRRLGPIPECNRRARFCCVIAIAAPVSPKHAEGHETRAVAGYCEGIIAGMPRGENGFGYDPIFYLPEFGRTMAELTAEEKNRISHRCRAARAALPILLELLSWVRDGK